MRILIKNFILLFAVSCMLHAGAAMAQFDLSANQLPGLNIKPTLSLTSNPLTPQPDSMIAVTANLTGITSVGNSNYTWFLNGVRQKETSGLNKNTFTFQAGNLGTVYRVGINVLTLNGDNLSDSISLTVSDSDLTWKASSEAPASYKGKLLPTQNSIIMVSALPFIYQPGTKTIISYNNLIFNWTMDNKFQADKSGAGKSDLLFRVSNYAGSNKSIRLEIKTLNGSISLIKGITIPIVRPQVLIYFADSKTNTPFGIAFKNALIKSINLNFIAQNYFFNSPEQNLKWQWFINNNEVGGGSNKPWLASLDLSNAGQLFSVQIQAIVKNPDNDLETAQSTINLQVQ